MKVVFALFFIGLVACVFASETPDLSDKSLTKDQMSSPVSSVAPLSSDNLSTSTTANPGDSSSTSAQPGDESKPKFCTRQYTPVCGSNGKTYNNKCEFENAQKLDPSITLSKTGAC